MSLLPLTRAPADVGAIVPEDIETELKPVRDRFRSLLAERILALEALRRRAANDDDPGPALENIADIAHKISGVGATLGFRRVGELAGILDRSLSELRKKPASYVDFRSEIAQQLEALLVELEALLDR